MRIRSRRQRAHRHKRSNPWKRESASSYCNEDVMYYIKNLAERRPKFLQRVGNRFLGARTKRAALIVSPSVVALVSFTGKDELSQGCGVIIESGEDKTFFVLTSANLVRGRDKCPSKEGVCQNSLAADLKVVVYLWNEKSCEGELYVHDFHYNLAVVKFYSESPLQIGKLRYLDDALDMNPNMGISDKKTFQILPHPSRIKLLAGNPVIIVGRYFAKPFDLMAAPGKYCLARSENDCKELLTSTCKITRCGDGSPVINRRGEVIGVAFYYFKTCFMPINIAHKWWEHYKRYGEHRRPFLGMEASNFHTAKVDKIEKIIWEFPNISKGVLVENVTSGTFAESAGLRPHDVIIRFGGKEVRSFLEFFEMIWENVGHPVEVVVVRLGHKSPFHLKMTFYDAKSCQLNSWPRLP